MCDRCLKCSDQISAQSKSIVHLQQAEGTVDARTRKWETTALIHMFHFTEENYSNHDDVAFVVPDKHPENETRRPGRLFYFKAALSHVSPSAQTLQRLWFGYHTYRESDNIPINCVENTSHVHTNALDTSNKNRWFCDYFHNLPNKTIKRASGWADYWLRRTFKYSFQAVLQISFTPRSPN